MSGNTGTGGIDHENYARELSELRHVLDTVEVVGWPRRDGELAELRRLVTKYAIETKTILADLGHT